MNLADNTEKSNGQIRNFYAGKHVFLTGCTGFYGSVILEKLLRTCTEIGNVYIMIREKKGYSTEERLERFFKKDVFNTLHAVNPNFMDKVIPIYGDLSKTDLGFSVEDRQRLVNNVNIIIHNASMVYFEAKVSLLLRINVLGTQQMLELAAECRNLNAFVYVSTAYSHHYMNPIEEKFYASPCNLKMIEDMIRADEENAAGLSEEAVNDIVGKWLNLYAYSKAVVEGVVEDFSRRRSLPCIVYRPSIIICALREPYPSWIDTKNGPVLLMTVAALGLLHVARIRTDLIIDFIPVDMTVNGLLTAIWDYVIHRKTNEPQVYNYASSDWNPIHMFKEYDKFMKIIERCPSSKIVWYPFVLVVQNYYLFFILHLILHVFPAIIADMVLMSQGKKPRALKIVFKLTKQIRILHYFMNTSWIIKTDKLKSVTSSVNATDLKEFPFDLKQIKWTDVMEIGMLSVRKVVNDPIETLAYAKRKYQKLKIAHYVTITLASILILFFLFTRIFNLFCS